MIAPGWPVEIVAPSTTSAGALLWRHRGVLRATVVVKASFALANIGEAMMSHGDNAQAIDLIKKGIERGISDPGELDMAKLHLGIAQFRSGDKEAARTTWAEVKADNGAGALARNWVLISQIQS